MTLYVTNRKWVTHKGACQQVKKLSFPTCPVQFLSGSTPHCPSQGLFSFLGSSLCCPGVQSVRHHSNLPRLAIALSGGGFHRVPREFFLSLNNFPSLVFLAIDTNAQPALAGRENVQFRAVFIQLKPWFANTHFQPVRSVLETFLP
jgi:hypothetical protein